MRGKQSFAGGRKNLPLMWWCCLNNSLKIPKHQRLKDKPFNFKTSLKLSSSQGSVQATEWGLGENVQGPPSHRGKKKKSPIDVCPLSPSLPPSWTGLLGPHFVLSCLEGDSGQWVTTWCQGKAGSLGGPQNGLLPNSCFLMLEPQLSRREIMIPPPPPPPEAG